MLLNLMPEQEPPRPSASSQAAFALDRIVLERLSPISLGLVVIFFFFALAHGLNLPAPAAGQIVAHDVGIIAIGLLLWLAINRQVVPLHWSHLAATFITLLVASNILFIHYLIQFQISTIFLMIVIIASGQIFLSLRWLSLTLAVISGAWMLMIGQTLATDDLIQFGLLLLSAAITSFSFSAGRIRTHRHLRLLREQDTQQKAALQRALARAERDLAQRKIAEAEKERLAQKLQRAQKMEAIGNLAGGVAHDMNNILAAIMGLCELIKLEDLPGAETRADLESITGACKRGRDLTQNLLGFARKGKYRKERVNLNKLVGEVMALMTRTGSKKVAVYGHLDPSLGGVEGDPTQLNQVLVNLAINASDAMPEGGTLRFTTTRALIDESAGRTFDPWLAPGAYIKLEVSDTGSGMPPQVRERAFDPFFTTKPQGKGTGLGLSMVYGAVINHGGAVLLNSEEGHGTAVTLFLPEHKSLSASPSGAPKERDHLYRGTGTILLVDDEAKIRKMGRRILEHLGYQVILAGDGEEALRQFQERREEIALVVLDLIMPVMDGAETLRRLRQLDPATRVLISSGFSEEMGAEMEAVGFIQKPYTLELFSEKVSEALGLHQRRAE
jgi:two-component system, cell cycle sensor histidine kinase and response regulator CckA